MASDTLAAKAGFLAGEARLDADAFRENTVYNGDGDAIRLIANAERLEQYAETMDAQASRIEALEAENGDLKRRLDNICMSIHTCTGDECERPICIANRKNKALEAALRVEIWNGLKRNGMPDDAATAMVKARMAALEGSGNG